MTSDPPFDERVIDVQAGCWTPVFRFALALSNDWDRPVLPWLLTTTRRLGLDRFRRRAPAR
jgi:hypothetical protein